MAVVEKSRPALSTAASVFERGNLSVTSIGVDPSSASSPPKSLLLVTPTGQGKYPVLVFLHGFAMVNTSYSHLLQHVSSHGFIVVAPQFSACTLGCQEMKSTAAIITDWLPKGLRTVLPDQVDANLGKLALSGHSKGGKLAFALALAQAQTSLKFSALLAIDPVDGISKSFRTPPKVLTYVPRSLDMRGTPVAVIGTGLGPKSKNFLMPACAPDGVNHAEFFQECKPPCCYFVAEDYGHMDMLDDGKFGRCACASGKGDMDPMRRCVGGIAVAFLRAYLEGDSGDLEAIFNDPTIAPIHLYPVIFLEDQ